MRFWSSMKAAVSDRLAEPARDLGHEIGAEALDDLVKRPRHWRQRGQLLDQRVAPTGGLATFYCLAVAHHRPRGEIALAVGEGLVKLHRKGMGEVVEDVFPRGDVDADVVPLLGRDL